MKNITKKLSLIAVALISTFTLLLAPQVSLADTASTIKSGACEAAGGTCPSDPGRKINDTIATAINVLSVIAGIIAVVFIIVAGLRYITSGGESSKVALAKNALIYSIIGLVVVALAQVIVRFVLHQAA